MNYAEADYFTGVQIENGRFFVLFEHPIRNGQSIAKKRLQLRDKKDVDGLRRALDAWDALNGQGVHSVMPVDLTPQANTHAADVRSSSGE